MNKSNIKFRPILFSTPMVQALIEGTKTQTRRTKGLEDLNESNGFNSFEVINDGGVIKWLLKPTSHGWCKLKCPYTVDDVLWVKESFYYAANWDHATPRFLASIGEEVNYKANDSNYSVSKPLHKGKLRPSLFMPKEACRIFLKIKAIRVERLNEISEEDAIAEGVTKIADYGSTGYKLYTEPDASYTDIDAIESFSSFWESIIGEGSWNKNPFVFVYELERIEKPIDFK
jgi:hypothetical protein